MTTTETTADRGGALGGDLGTAWSAGQLADDLRVGSSREHRHLTTSRASSLLDEWWGGFGGDDGAPQRDHDGPGLDRLASSDR